jgi:hypothetical protein
MTTKFPRHELPLAYAMIENARRVRPRRDAGHLYQKYFLLWTAFNSIYTTIAHRHGLRTRIMEDEHGDIIRIPNGNVSIPKVGVVSEIKQIFLSMDQIDEDLKHNLITHQSTEYFVNRIPAWDGIKIEFDSLGQKVNGVINVDYTSDHQNPVWSPIDTQFYQEYFENPDDKENRDFLARQVVDLLLTIRLNLMHGGKRFDDANDINVVENALPMLEMIVYSFTS